jgi:transposase
VGYAAADLAPLYERLKEHLLVSSRLAVDETPVPVLDPGRGRTKTGYFWSMARDDRPFGGKDQRSNDGESRWILPSAASIRRWSNG